MTINTAPYPAIGEDLSTPNILQISPAQLIPNTTNTIIISGVYLTEETWVTIDDCQTISTQLIAPEELKVVLNIGNTKGIKTLFINRHIADDNHRFDNLISVADLTIIPQTNEMGWLELNQNTELKIGTSNNDEIRHYRYSVPYRNNDGMYWNRSGWVSFPVLSWNREQNKSVDFIFYLRGDRYMTFGLINENYNIYRTNIIDAVCGFRFVRNYYYASYGNGLFNRLGYEQIERYKYYRFRINNNGKRQEKIQLFQLKGKDKEHWDSGDLFLEKTVPLNFVEEGNILTPIVFEYNRYTNPILAVRAI